MAIQERILEVKIAMELVKDHCLCFNFFEEDNCYIVYLPQRIAGLDGIKIDINNNKKQALTKIVEKLEELWRHDYTLPI